MPKAGMTLFEFASAANGMDPGAALAILVNITLVLKMD